MITTFADIETMIYFVIADLFLLALVAIALGVFVNSIADNTLLERKFITADAKLLIETIKGNFLPENTDYNEVEDEASKKK